MSYNPQDATFCVRNRGKTLFTPDEAALTKQLGVPGFEIRHQFSNYDRTLSIALIRDDLILLERHFGWIDRTRYFPGRAGEPPSNEAYAQFVADARLTANKYLTENGLSVMGGMTDPAIKPIEGI